MAYFRKTILLLILLLMGVGGQIVQAYQLQPYTNNIPLAVALKMGIWLRQVGKT